MLQEHFTTGLLRTVRSIHGLYSSVEHSVQAMLWPLYALSRAMIGFVVAIVLVEPMNLYDGGCEGGCQVHQPNRCSAFSASRATASSYQRWLRRSFDSGLLYLSMKMAACGSEALHATGHGRQRQRQPSMRSRAVAVAVTIAMDVADRPAPKVHSCYKAD